MNKPMNSAESDAIPAMIKRLRQFVRRRVSHAQDAEDLVQDVLVKLHEHRDELPDDRVRLAWTLRVARNAVIDHYRRRSLPAQIADYALAAPADRTLAAAEMKCVDRMVQLLPAEARQALLLADAQDVPQQQIAQRLGISLSGAKSRVQRARRQLRGMVLDCCDVEFDTRGGIVDYEPTQRSKQYCHQPCAM